MAVGLLAVLLASCGAETASSTYLPPSPPIVPVAMREYSFVHRERILPRGRVVLRVHNAGREPHELVLVSLPEDLPPIDEQLRSESGQPVPTVASLHPRPPGGRTAVALSLTPGRYAMICFVKGPDGTRHAFMGMSSEFRVR